MILALDNILRDFFNLKFYPSEAFDSWKNDEQSPGGKAFWEILKITNGAEKCWVVAFFDHIYNFLSSNFNSLGKMRQEYENSKAELLNFQKNG